MNRKIFLISVLVFCFDQVTKLIVDTIYTLNNSVSIIGSFFSITYSNNSGAAWGIFHNKVPILVVVSLISLVLIYSQIYTFKTNKRNNIAFGLITGGIIGNLIDRLFLGYVRDFFDFHIFNYDFPIFNIADMCMVIGVILLFIAIFKGEDVSETYRRRNRQTKN